MKKNISRIRLLMIISYILLAGFMIQWLIGLYGREKEELRGELNRQFRASEQAAIDSLVFPSISNTIMQLQHLQNRDIHISYLDKLNDSILNSNITILKKSDILNDSIISLQHNYSFHYDSKDTPPKKQRPPKAVIQLDSNIIQHIDSVRIRREPVLFDKIFSGSMSRLIAGKDAFPSEFGLRWFTDKLDESVLKTDFARKLADLGMKPLWSDESDKFSAGDNDLHYKSSSFSSPLAVTVTGYRSYIYRRIAGNILFGFILLLLTGTAFMVSFISLKKQVQLNTMRNDFVGNITHELKTPVATMKVVLEALQSYNVKTDSRRLDEYIRIASLEVERLDMLVHRILTSIVRSDAKDAAAPAETIDLNDVLQSTVAALQTRLDAENAVLKIQLLGNNFTVEADKIHLEGIILNLIDNSLKYNGKNPEILIVLTEENEQVKLSVSDNGTGIPDEYLPKVFDRFFRVPSENIHNVKGHGLGLCYVEMIVKQQNGTIFVKNNKDAGCTFTVVLPKHKE